MTGYSGKTKNDMATSTVIKENWIANKAKLLNEISSLKKCMASYKEERKTEKKKKESS